MSAQASLAAREQRIKDAAEIARLLVEAERQVGAAGRVKAELQEVRAALATLEEQVLGLQGVVETLLSEAADQVCAERAAAKNRLTSDPEEKIRCGMHHAIRNARRLSV